MDNYSHCKERDDSQVPGRTVKHSRVTDGCVGARPVHAKKAKEGRMREEERRGREERTLARKMGKGALEEAVGDALAVDGLLAHAGHHLADVDVRA